MESSGQTELNVGQVAQSMHRARMGSDSALMRLLELCRPYLASIATAELSPELRQKVGASDVVQETLFEAQRDLPQFLGGTEEELIAWLRRILLNNVANARRRFLGTEKRNAAREVQLEESSDGRGPLNLVRSRDAGPSSIAVRSEEAELLQEALQRLPQHLREVLVLRHREGCSFAEIGTRIGRSPAAARKLWVRAVEKLQRELEPRLRGDGPRRGSR